MIRTYEVRVATRAKKNCVKKLENGFKVYLTAPPAEGKANRALLEILAEHLKIKRSQLSIIKGLHSKDKVVKVTP